MAKSENGSGQARRGAESFELKIGLAEMLKGGVIMDVTDAAQAHEHNKHEEGSVTLTKHVPNIVTPCVNMCTCCRN